MGDVTLPDATRSSDADGDPLSFAWSLISAPADSGVQISSPNAMSASFVPHQIGDYVFELAVMDAKGAIMTDTEGPGPGTDCVTIYSYDGCAVGASGISAINSIDRPVIGIERPVSEIRRGK